MRDAPVGLVFALTNAAAEATIEQMASDPANSAQHCQTGFDAMWRMIG